MKEVETLRTWLEESRQAVFFGGAGVSTESGIPDFRSVGGLYQQSYDYPPETIISHIRKVNGKPVPTTRALYLSGSQHIFIDLNISATGGTLHLKKVVIPCFFFILSEYHFLDDL